MIIAHQVQNAVDEKRHESFHEVHFRVFGLVKGRISGNHHVAEQIRGDIGKGAFLHGKGNHVGGAFVIQVCLVQPCDFFITDNQNGKLGIRKIQCREDAAGRCPDGVRRQAVAGLAVFDQNVHFLSFR